MPLWTSAGIRASLTVLVAATALATFSAAAQEVGEAAAVNPQSQGTPPGSETRVLRIGRGFCIIPKSAIRFLFTQTLRAGGGSSALFVF
jgi:hypothetical protein